MKKKKPDGRLYSTKLLLKSLPELREYVEDVIVTPADLDRNFALRCLMNDLRNDPDMCLESARQSRARTLLLIAHVERVIEKWERAALTRDDKQLRTTARWFYERGFSAEEVAAKTGINIRHVYLQWHTVIRELAPMFFGSDGVMRELMEAQK